MTKGYTKLFADIITSSVWSEDNNTRIMWITMLASSDASGHVSGTIPGMAAISRLSLEDAEKAIKTLCNPDPYSRTPDSEGRRLVPCDGGWTITTYKKHRARRDESDRREYQRQWDRENRPSGQNRKPQSDKKSDKSDTVRPNPTKAEAEAEAEKESVRETEKPKTNRTVFNPPTVEEVQAYIRENNLHVDPDEFFHHNTAKGWVVGKTNKKMENWRSAIQTWEQTWKKENPGKVVSNFGVNEDEVDEIVKAYNS